MAVQLAEGEWGKSKFTGRPITHEVALALPLTLKLVAEMSWLWSSVHLGA